jgi:hypothetical protein
MTAIGKLSFPEYSPVQVNVKSNGYIGPHLPIPLCPIKCDWRREPMDVNWSIASFAMNSPLDRTMPPACRQLSLIVPVCPRSPHTLVQIGFNLACPLLYM